MALFSIDDFSTKEGQEKIIKFLNYIDGWSRGMSEQITDLTEVNQDALIAKGKVYAKPENLGR